MHIRLTILLGVSTWALLFLFSSCQKDPAHVPASDDIIATADLAPNYFPPAFYSNPKNPLSKKGIALGRKLFYDPILSGSNNLSCASCHLQSNAFSHPGQATSPGEAGIRGNRNAPALFNVAWNPTYMWDGGITHLEIMPFAPISSPIEMNQDMKALLNELRNEPAYVADFKDVFGPSGITEVHFFYALSQFLTYMVSANSKYDAVRQGQRQYTASEARGYSLFIQHCNQCHTEPLFTNHAYENNGLELVSADSGRGRVTALPQDMAKFKIPSLRNIALTYPYMHDGRLQTLQDVLRHYSSGIVAHPNLHPSLQGGIPLSPSEENDIIDFLNTLTDQTFISNPALSRP